MKKWPIHTVGDLATVVMGQSPPGDTYNTQGQGLPFFQGKAEFGDEYPETRKWCDTPLRIAEPGDILLSVRAPVGPTNIARERCCFGRGLAAIRPKNKSLKARFLRYFFTTIESHLARQGAGSTFAAISREIIEGLELPLPPLQEQENIVRVLDEAHALRRLRIQADELTLTFTPSLFQKTFGDPFQNNRGWPISTVGDHLAMIEYGPRFYNEAYTDSGTRIVRITDLDGDGNLRFDDMPRIEVDAKILESRQLKPGDIIFARTGATVGKTALIPDNAPPCIAGAYFIRLRFSEVILPLFGFELLRCPVIQGIIAEQSKQAAQQNFSGPLIKALPLIMPPLELQRSYAKHVEKIRALLSEQTESRSELDHLFGSLLNQAFAGAL